jgi:hypothetical protein
MNPLHQRTTGGAPAASELVPEAHGYGFIAASEATVNAQSEAPNVQSATPKVTPPAQQAPESAPAEVSPEPVETPLIEFITDTPAEATEAPAESATASVVLSPLLPNIGTSTMARLLHLPEVPVNQDIPDDAVRLLVVEASEKGMAAVFSHIDRLRAQLPETPGSVTSLESIGGILVIPADRQRTPRPVKLKLKVLSGAHPVLMCPWIPALASRLCDDEVLAKAAEARPVASALKKLTAQIEGLAG